MASKIHKRKDNGKFVLSFQNPMDKTNNSKQIKTSSDFDEIRREAEKLDYEFYSKHPYLIPHGISLDTKNRRFRIYTRFGYVATFFTLNEAIKAKLQILEDLTSPKYNKKNFGLISNGK